MASSPLGSQVEQHISQQIQRVSQLHRVHQGLAAPVLMVKPVKVIPADLKGRDTPRRVLDPDPVQAAALAQEKRADKNVRRLVVLDTNHLPGTP
jgi:hypothetical protein